MNYILYHYEFSGNKYTQMVVNAMKESCNLVAKRKEGWFEYTQQEKTWKPLKSIMKILEGDNRIINWGNHIFKDDGYFDLNKPSAISRTSHKTNARKILQNAGIKVPRTYFWDESNQLVEGIDVEFPLIARPPKHEKGKNFFALYNIEDLEKLYCKNSGNIQDWYFSEIFEKTDEYRVHVAHGKVLLVNEKSFVHGNLMQTVAVNDGDWYVLGWQKFNKDLCRESIKAAEVLGLDYAAVDIMYNSKNKTFAICELNTDQDVGTPYVSGKYASYFDWCIRHNFPKHFSLEDNTNVFYSDMLKS